MLFHPDRHEPLSPLPWQAERAHEALRTIVRDIEHHQMGPGVWPVHPGDLGSEPVPPTAYHSVYLGGAGVVWALSYLQRAGAVQLDRDPALDIDAVVQAYRAAPDTGSVVPSFFLGEVGVLLVQWRLRGEASVAEQLFDAVRANIANPTNEALWAAPGTMLAAWHLWQATGEARWRSLYLANVDQLWRTWLYDDTEGTAGCWLWTQDLYGAVVQYFGAGHGFAGNAFALLKGAQLLDDERRLTLLERCVATLQATARREGDAVNWPVSTTTPRPGRPQALLQWCHGAPGIITAMSPVAPGQSAAIDELLLAGGQAIWQAGPLIKGHGLCHGTSGNGQALLALYQRTGDAIWLDRARAFAMHAVSQYEHTRQREGRGRYALWNGDAGLAVFLWHCLTGQGGMPLLDVV
jgi:hypothetical protein